MLSATIITMAISDANVDQKGTYNQINLLFLILHNPVVHPMQMMQIL